VKAYNEAVTYPRVSSKEQAMSGFSIPAQQRKFRDYCRKNGLSIVKEYVEVQSASKRGRRQLKAMVDYVKETGIKHMVFDSVDRLARNLFDHSYAYTLMEEFGITLHFVSDGMKMNNNSKSGEKLSFDMRGVISKNQTDQLSEKVISGLDQKVFQGGYPRAAPIGYFNDRNTRAIEIDPTYGPFVKQLFEWYATGSYSVPELRKKAKDAGYLSTLNKYKASRNTFYNILKNPTYCGKIPYKGQILPGNHSPLISEEVFNKVQDVLQGKSRPTRANKHQYAYTSLFVCSECGYAITAEKKREKHVYYRCTQARFGCGNTKKHVNQGVIEDQVLGLLGRFSLNGGMVKWVQSALSHYHSDSEKKKGQLQKSLKQTYDSIQLKIEQGLEQLGTGALNERIWKSLSTKWQRELQEVETALTQCEDVVRPYYDDPNYLKKLIGRFPELFQKQDDGNKQRMMKLLIEKSPLTKDEIDFSLKNPFIRLSI